jgi:hypothetical protein
MFGSLQAEAGGVNVLKHNRVPTPVEHIAMHRRKESREILKRQRKLDVAKRTLTEATRCLSKLRFVPSLRAPVPFMLHICQSC